MNLAAKLAVFGWNQFFEDKFAEYAAQGFQVGRVALEEKENYRLYTAEGEFAAEISGRMRYQARDRADLPAVGDWVVYSTRNMATGRAKIHEILPRKSKFSRKVPGSKTAEQIVAANIDTLFLVSGMDNDLNPRRIERYLILAWDSGATPVIVLNKVDLCKDPETQIKEIEAVALGVPIIPISARNNHGMEAVRSFIVEGKTASLIGSSGVGKSTIINTLAGRDIQKTQAVRVGDERGQHTTTHRELILLPGGGLIIDTPGMRELQLWLGEKGLQDAFEDINELGRQCHFRNCNHQEEPGCAIREALADGTLATERYESYLKMQQELKYLAQRNDQRAALIEKERWKKIHNDQKKHYNNKKKY